MSCPEPAQTFLVEYTCRHVLVTANSTPPTDSRQPDKWVQACRSTCTTWCHSSHKSFICQVTSGHDTVRLKHLKSLCGIGKAIIVSGIGESRDSVLSASRNVDLIDALPRLVVT